MKKYWILMLVLALALALGLAVACSSKKSGDDDSSSDDDIFDDDSSDDTTDDTGDDTDCTNNVAPELLDTAYVVNGSQATAPISIVAGDLFGIYFSYNDDDCNLPGGQFWFSDNGAAYEALSGTLPDELGCSSAASGLSYGVSLTTDAMTPATYTYGVKWTDVCGAESNEMTGEYTITAK